MYKLIKLPNPNNPYDDFSVEMTTTEEQSLSDLLELYSCFLRACGFSFRGEIDIIDNELTPEQKEDFNDFLDSTRSGGGEELPDGE